MTKLYQNCAVKATVLLVSAISSTLLLSAQCPSGSLSVTNNGAYNNGQIACVSSSFSGNITLNSGSQLYIASGGSFTGSINAASNVQVYVQSNGNFAPSGVNNFGGKITNNGKANINFNMPAGAQIINNATLSVNGNISGVINIMNSSCGSLSFISNATLSTSGITLTNNGYVSVPGSLVLNSGDLLTNKGKIYVQSTSSLVGKIINDGYIVVTGNSDFTGQDSLTNFGVIVISSTLSISKPILNKGLFWINGNTTFNNGSGYTQAGTVAYLRVDSKINVDSRNVTGTGVASYNKLNVSNSGSFTIASTTVLKDTTNYVASYASPARPCGAAESPLPIILQSFTAKTNGNAAELHWSTVSELNGKGITVQHSTDGVSFEDIKEVASSTNSSLVQNYSYVDYNAVNGANYYRLKLESSDASALYSPVLAVKFTGTASGTTTVYPNPFSDHVTVNLAEVQSGNAMVKLYNDKGAVVLVKSLSGAAIETINMSSYLPKGFYILEVINGSDKSCHRLIKL